MPEIVRAKQDRRFDRLAYLRGYVQAVRNAEPRWKTRKKLNMAGCFETRQDVLVT